MAWKRRGLQLLMIVAVIRCVAPAADAQEIQNGLSYRDISAAGYFRFNYENDVFFGTDRYFTQGVHFELANRTFSRSFIPLLFPRVAGGYTRSGIGLESAGYSPSSITADSILYGDHPFAGLAYLKLFSISIDTVCGRRISGTLSLGWMGPSAGGYEIQAAIHQAVGSSEPLGWKYQLKDQPVINYELNAEQEIGGTPRWLRVSGWGMIRAGTLSNRVAFGGILNAGLISKRRIQLRMYAHPVVAFPVYESVLQGGPFTRSNPYRIDSEDLRRVVGSLRSGVAFSAGSLHLGVYVRWQSATFRGGAAHALGGLSIARAF